MRLEPFKRRPEEKPALGGPFRNLVYRIHVPTTRGLLPPRSNRLNMRTMLNSSCPLDFRSLRLRFPSHCREVQCPDIAPSMKSSNPIYGLMESHGLDWWKSMSRATYRTASGA